MEVIKGTKRHLQVAMTPLPRKATPHRAQRFASISNAACAAQRRSKTTSSGRTNPMKLLPCGKTSANHTSYKSINREMSGGC